MIAKKTQLSLISAALVGLFHLPAQADTANVQSSSQDAAISGDNNQITQVNNQVIINAPNRGSVNSLEARKKKAEARLNAARAERGERYGSSHKNDENCEDD